MKNVSAAVRAVARKWKTPFSLYAVYEEQGVIHVQVQVDQVDAARAYFSEHRVVLISGQVVPVEITGVRAERWDSWPLRPPAEPPQVPEGLVGIDVYEAARLANEVGWVVQATQPDGVMDASIWPSRLNLIYDEYGRVLECFVG